MTASPVLEEPLDAEEKSQQFVSFILGGDTFGVRLNDVQEIIRFPDVVRVPLAPQALLGLANLRGMVLPIASLRNAFGLEQSEPDDEMRVVVVNRGVPMGIVVDKMSAVLTAELADIETVEHLESVAQTDLIEKVVKVENGRVMVFDPIRVLDGVFGSMSRSEEASRRDFAAGGGPAHAEEDGLDNETRLVGFELGGEEYAFDLARVKEIVTLPETIASVPSSPSSVMGIMVLRERILPLVSLRSLLGLPSHDDEGAPQRVVVTTGYANEDLVVGVVVDSVREVLRLSPQEIDPVPSLLADERRDLEAVCRLDEGKRVVTVLNVEVLLDVEAISSDVENIQEEDDMQQAESRGARSVEPEEQFVVFRIEGEAYGVAVDSVQEIVRVPEEMTKVPKAPPFVEGVINLRGDVLPVICQRARFGLAATERSDRQRIVVLKVDEQLLGFIVDSVAEVRKIPASVIGPAPSLSEEQANLIRRVANLGEDKGIVMLLEAGQLVASVDGFSAAGIAA